MENVSLPASFTPLYLKKLQLHQLNSKRAFLGSRQGGHFSLKRGHGIEFSDYRKYELGDDPRHIDWNLMARSERAYIKRFREEQDLLIHIFLDTSNSMFLPDDSKWQRVKELALSFVYIASMQHDRVQIALPGVISAKKYSGKNIIYQLARDLSNLDLPKDIDFFTEVKASVAASGFPGLAFFISDFLNEPEKIKDCFISMLGKNLDLTAIQILSEQDQNPDFGEDLIAIDSETKARAELVLDSASVKEYGNLLKEHNLELEKFSTRRQINWYSFRATDELDQVIARLL